MEPARAYSDAAFAAALAEAYAYPLDPWQRDVLECWLGRDSEGRLTALSCGLSMPRQNGKSYLVEALELALLVGSPGTRILHTAHQVRTSKRSFERLARVFEDPAHADLKSMVEQVRRTNGEEKIALSNGSAIEYVSRSRAAARGFDAISLVVYDEAQELTDEQVEALMATLAASPTGDRQVIYAGTPPSPGCSAHVFANRRDAALSDPSPTTAWHEWSVESMPPVDAPFADMEADVLATNPAMGGRLSMSFAREEFDAMQMQGFARERLGWWTDVAAEAEMPVIDADRFDALAVDGAPEGGRTAYGVKFTPDGAEVAVCAAMEHEGGVHVEAVFRESLSRGLTWLADWIAERKDRACCCVIDGKSGAPTLIGKLERMPFGYIVKPGADDVIAAAGSFLDAVNSSSLSWYSGQSAFRDACVTATRRRVGTKGGWSFGGADADVVEAAMLAAWGVQTSKRDPKRRGMVG